MTDKTYKEDTKLAHWGRNPDDYHGIVNPPVCRSSTIIYPSLGAYEDKNHQFRYGRLGNPMSQAFEDTISALEEGYKAVSTPSGLSSITTTLLAFLKSGDHLLMVDSVYPPVRDFCDRVLTRMGIEVEYYDPCVKDAGALFKGNTAIIYMESPGSATFEIQDVPAIVKAAKAANIKTVFDNTWAGGILFKPLKHGVDISVQAATKYISGHSDVNLGVAVAANEALYKQLKETACDLGMCAGQEDMYLALRGLRTIKLRLKQNAENALKIAHWLKSQPEIERVYFPALEDDPHHALWKRDFEGVNGIMGFLLKPSSKKAVEDFVNGLELFPIGSSWGGYESLLQPQYIKSCRTAVPWSEKGTLLRLQIGLEDPEDLIVDLAEGLKRFNAA